MTLNPTVSHTSDYTTLQALSRRFWTWRAEHMPISYDDIPRMERPAGWVPDWSTTAIAKRKDDLARYAEEMNAIDCSAWPVTQQVDYRLIASALARVHWELDITRSHELNPDFYVHQTLGAIFLLLLKPAPFGPQRCKEINIRLRSVPKTTEAGKQNLRQNAIRPFAIAAIEKLTRVRQCL